MWSNAPDVAPGDLVIVWQTRDLVQPLVVSPGDVLNTRFGHYRHDDLLGVPYGSKLASRNGRGFVHVLRPTPELWTVALPHRTQILYLADIAFITAWLDIRRGTRVIEAGTGSGSFSHSIARTVGPSGHLYSYEFHQARADKARHEFVRHGMQDTVTLQHRNVCKDGFAVTDHVDAVFLDLPAPWDAIEHAKKALRKDGPTRICCFSPCVEQVLRTVNALNEAGFTDVTTYETLLRPHEVHQLPPPRPLSEAVDKLKRMEKYREEKRLRQIANSSAGKRKREDEQTGAVSDALAGAAIEGGSDKRVKVDVAALDEPSLEIVPLTPPEDGTPDAIAGPSCRTVEPVPGKVNYAKACPDVRGHTSYLTFARLVPFPNDVPPVE